MIKSFMKKLNPFAVDCIILTILAVPLFVAGSKINVPIRIIVPRLAFLLFCALEMIVLTRLVRKKAIRIIIAALFSIVLFILALLQSLEFYNFFMQEETFNTAFYMSMIDVDLIIELLPSQIHFLVAGLIYFSVFVAVFNLLVFLPKKATDKRKQTIIVASLSFAIVIAFICFGETAAGNFIKMVCEANEKIEVGEDYVVDKERYEKLGISVCNVGHDNLVIDSAGTRKNLIFIFLESIETNFLDDELFPGLTPNLNRFRKDEHTIFFTSMGQCAGHTAEAMFQTFWGVPSTPAFCTSSTSPEFNDEMLNKFCSLPFIFTKAGYTWEHIKAVNLGSFERALSNEGVSLDYLHRLKAAKDFCYRDKSLLEYTWNLFHEKEADPNQNFVISITTLDSHTPNGFVDKDSLEYPNKDKFPKNYGNFQLLDAIYTTDHYLGKLIDDILGTETGKNTAIAIMSDHRFMGTADNWLNKKERNNLFMIINAGEGKDISEKGCQLDIAPTILDLFNIRSNYIFPCGVSLFRAPSKDYSLRVLDSARKKELSKYAYSKIQKKKNEKTDGIAFNRDNHALINVFGTSVPIGLEKSGRMSYIALDENSFIVSVNETLESQTEQNGMKMLDNVLKEKNKCIFLFQPGKAKKALMTMIYEKIRLSDYDVNAKYALIYRDGEERYISVFSDNIDDLSIVPEAYKNVDDKSIVKIIQPPTMKSFSNLIAQDADDVRIVDNQIVISGVNSKILSRDFLVLEESSPVFISCRVKNTGNASTRIRCGFAAYDGSCGFGADDTDNSNSAVVIEAQKDKDYIVVQGAKLNCPSNGSILLNAFSSEIPNSHMLSSQIASAQTVAEFPLADIGPFAVPAYIKGFDPSIVTRISLAKPLNADIDKGCIISIAPSIETTFLVEDIMLDPGQESVLNYYSPHYKGAALAKPFIWSNSVDGKTEHSISISELLSITDCHP